MTEKKKINKEISSMKDFQKKYYPRAYAKSVFNALSDPRQIGAELATSSLKRAKHALAK